MNPSDSATTLIPKEEKSRILFDILRVEDLRPSHPPDPANQSEMQEGGRPQKACSYNIVYKDCLA